MPPLVPISPGPSPPGSPSQPSLAGPAAPRLVAIPWPPTAAATPAPITAAAPILQAAILPPPVIRSLPVEVPPVSRMPLGPPLPTPAMPASLAGPQRIAPLPLPPPQPVPQPVPPPALPPQAIPQTVQQPAPQAVALTPSPPPHMAPQPVPQAAAAPPAVPPASTGGKPTDAITIASFNIQVFGESKIAKPQVVDVLVRVVRSFDIVAIQEVRAKSDSVIPQFVAAINADGSRYQFVIGPRLGRTSSKEQYTFIYDSNRIEIDPSSVGTSPNPGDRLHRPPLHARFRVRTNPPASGFSFWLVDTHTDPDEVALEVNALAEVFQEMKALRPDEDDVILLGDLNAGPPQFGKIKQIPGIGWAVSGVTTNTRRSKTYDNLIFDRAATSEYTGRWGVLDLQDAFRLPLDKALEVSDHNPVWAAFRPWETQRMGAL